MHRLLAVSGLFLLAATTALCEPPKKPDGAFDQFLVGRHSSFDFGPPFHYYEIYIVHATLKSSSVERITLTPAVGECVEPAQVETSFGTLATTIPQLLENADLCTIPKKDLEREKKRREKEVVYTGASVTVQVQCGNKRKVIQADIFDENFLENTTRTLQQTSWKLRLLSRLDRATGPSTVVDRPLLPSGGNAFRHKSTEMEPEIAERLSSGQFDLLFADAPDKPSEIYRMATQPDAKCTHPIR
jgi:hypothetical protein